MQKSLDIQPSARGASAPARNVRLFGNWRIPLPGRLPDCSETPTMTARARRQEEVFRRDLDHFLAGRAAVSGKIGRD